MICPAYQSAFIYDQDELRKKFSYFEQDTAPKIYTASKNKYLVAEPVSYHHKLRSMRTVQMKKVPVAVPDSISGKSADSVSMDDLDRAARSVIDSTVIVDVPRDTVAEQEELDSIYVITKDKELRLLKYNTSDSLDYDSATQKYIAQKPKYYVKEVRYQMEQDNYMWYLRDNLILPDVRLAKMAQARGNEGDGKNADGKSAKKKQGLKGFFKNLFKKKPKEQPDTIPQGPKEEFDYVDEPDTTLQAEIPQPGQEKKPKEKKLFGKKKSGDKPKRTPKEKKKPDDEEETPAKEEEEDVKKEEEDDDGF